jgi:hypothetical protein
MIFASATPYASLPLWPSIFLIILSFSTNLLTRMTSSPCTCNGLCMTSQSRGSFLKENNCFFITDQTPRPSPLSILGILHFCQKVLGSSIPSL